MQKIVDAVSANSSGEVEAGYFTLDGGPRTVIGKATAWGGATVTLRVSDDGGTSWYDLLSGGSAVTLTANGVIVIPSVAYGLMLGAKVAGGTGINALTVEVI